MTETSVLWFTGILNVAAIIAAPITALYVQRKGDAARSLRDSRQQLFKTLWANRARPVWLARVDALNMIDVEFRGQAKVVDAWADLFAHYKADKAGISEAEQQRLHMERYSTLLYEMGQVLGYTFGKAHIRDDIYRPDIHFQLDKTELETRLLLLQLLKGEPLPIRVVNTSETGPQTQTNNG